MAGQSPGLTKAFKAEAAIASRRIVKFGAADDAVLQGAAGADFVIGVSTDIPAAIGETVDVCMEGIRDITYGGNVARGALLMSDANGKAITATAGAGVNVRTIGTALVSAALDDIGPAHIKPGVFQG